jgi:hypothetical protein
MSTVKSLAAATALVAFTSAPAFALSIWFPHSPGGGGSGIVSHSAPGPVAGIGLPVAAVVGGYIWLKRRSRQKHKD